MTQNGEWWRGSVTYQIYPRSFQDTNGDGIGDLAGITARLDHVARLGVDAIWLSPIFPSPMDDMGYDVSNYTDIEPLFGSLADFDAMVTRAHALGLKVIIDQVLSHSSDRHPWFIESRASREGPRADWYVWADPLADGTPPNNWLSVFGGPAWEWSSRRRQYYLHNFLTSQPDLNFHNGEVQDALLATMRFWLDRGVDGFRLDTVNFYFHDKLLRSNPPEERADPIPAVNPFDMQFHCHSKTQPENIAFLKRMRALLDEYEDRAMVGEIGGETTRRAVQVMADYTRGGDRLHMAYSFDMLGPDFHAGHFRARVERFFAAAPDGWPCWSFSNHDVVRHVTRWADYAHDQDALARQAAALLLSLTGSVCIYQGEELGLPEARLDFEELTDPPGIRFWPDHPSRDGARTPMPWDGAAANCGFSTGRPWLPIKSPHGARSVAAQEGDAHSVLNFYRRMLGFRRAAASLRHAPARFLATDEPVLAFSRGAGEAALHCVFNLWKEPLEIEAGNLALRADAPSQAASLGNGRLALGANGFAFLGPSGRAAARLAYRA